MTKTTSDLDPTPATKPVRGRGGKSRGWADVKADLDARGTRDPKARENLLAIERAHRLAEVRKGRALRQTDVAAEMGVSQSRVSAIEHGRVEATEVATLAAYVEALGGRLELVANFGDERLVIA